VTRDDDATLFLSLLFVGVPCALLLDWTSASVSSAITSAVSIITSSTGAYAAGALVALLVVAGDLLVAAGVALVWYAFMRGRDSRAKAVAVGLFVIGAVLVDVTPSVAALGLPPAGLTAYRLTQFVLAIGLLGASGIWWVRGRRGARTE
jgi:hypothetical protein